MKTEVEVQIGGRTITIATDIPNARELILTMAATIAAGIESTPAANPDWDSEDTVKRALSIATDLFIAVGPRT